MRSSCPCLWTTFRTHQSVRSCSRTSATLQDLPLRAERVRPQNRPHHFDQLMSAKVVKRSVDCRRRRWDLSPDARCIPQSTTGPSWDQELPTPISCPVNRLLQWDGHPCNSDEMAVWLLVNCTVVWMTYTANQVDIQTGTRVSLLQDHHIGNLSDNKLSSHKAAVSSQIIDDVVGVGAWEGWKKSR